MALEGGHASRTAGIVVIGDEILSGEVEDLNAPFLLRRLWDLGIHVDRMVVVPDRIDEISGEVGRLHAARDYLFVTGGIGPTHDDVTRAAIARALGLDVEHHAEAAQALATDYGASITPAEAAMAHLPAGAELMRGVRRGAFGFRVANVYAFPGVPVLVEDIFEGAAPGLASSPLFKSTIWVDGKEGDFSDALAEIQATHTDVVIGSYPVFTAGRYRCKVVLRTRDAGRLEEVAAAIGLRLTVVDPPGTV